MAKKETKRITNPKLKKCKKEVKLKITYCENIYDEATGSCFGSVTNPKHQKELEFEILDDYVYNEEADDFLKSNMRTIEISGTDRALMEFGKFLVNFAMYETKDPNFHHHLWDFKDFDGETAFNLTVRKKK